MDASWRQFLRGAGGPEHAAQFYGEPDELAASVAAFLAVGFATGEPAITVATPEHRRLVESHLAGCGWDAGRAAADGLLVHADAGQTLDSFMRGTGPDGALFREVVGGLVDAVAARFPGKRLRLFGEMVDLLCARGQVAAAVALEELWNDLGRDGRFSLLCGYRAGDGRLLDEVCRVHSQVLIPG